tara:strand:+ start:252 stop:725 length:474 start_codon:yes stop_codon:yes gene_type:complete
MTTTITGATGIDNIQAATGAVLQVVDQTFVQNVSTTSTSWVSTGITASITPSSTSSKILVLVQDTMYLNSADKWASWTVFRGSVSGTNLGHATRGFASFEFATGNDMTSGASISVLDSPSTTSAQTYTVGFKTTGGTTYSGHFGLVRCGITLMEIAG